MEDDSIKKVPLKDSPPLMKERETFLLPSNLILFFCFPRVFSPPCVFEKGGKKWRRDIYIRTCLRNGVLCRRRKNAVHSLRCHRKLILYPYCAEEGGVDFEGGNEWKKKCVYNNNTSPQRTSCKNLSWLLIALFFYRKPDELCRQDISFRGTLNAWLPYFFLMLLRILPYSWGRRKEEENYSLLEFCAQSCQSVFGGITNDTRYMATCARGCPFPG